MERVDLLKSDDGGIGDLVFLLVILEVVKNFSAAKNDTTGSPGDGGIGQNFLETTLGEVGHRAGGSGIPKEAFWRHDDQRLYNFAKGLAPDEVKVVRRSGRVGDDHVVFGAELEESFETGAGVFRTLAVVSVRKKESEAGGGAPFGFGGGDVLIDLGLGAVGKIPELGFPKDEHFGAIEGVTIVETEDGGFGERAVVNAEGGLGF